ncbi:MAG TPA: bifunctional [glutamate--ammonia ligase]-adenylyl-L-tyrosine phosphorylase/[glutamate--ammonia-ligase] adenylyltransferase [Woeseiaceae bacterium]|nr:bifunctional [glutamate--ammonia ligase]-adenylyl-L-tyrosine phosphorylase/[glutamate--ammonia-ligase] adenylyltransferase [Woeseiaceae bacterium]
MTDTAEIPGAIAASVAALPAPLVAPTTRWLERILRDRSLPGNVDPATFVRLVATSEFAAGVLLRDFDGFVENAGALAAGYDPAALSEFAASVAGSDADTGAIKSLLRRERNRQLVGIAWREAAGTAGVEDTLVALSDVADRLLAAAAGFAARRIALRFGVVRGADGGAVPLVVIGMGKLGGGELNFSSDIDIIFAYPEDGESDGPRTLAAQPYFDRLARAVVDLLDDVTADGFVFRTDTRLRPFGDSGPPVVSFPALEAYLLQHGRAWERYAYVKARRVGPAVPESVERALFDDLVRPFVYRAYVDFGVFESLRDMHALIAAEVSRRELADNVKLGPGGIREIEFIVQSLQLVRGGRRPALQSPSLLHALTALVSERGLDASAARGLAEAYRFLRRVENAIQAIRDQQTHDLPADPVDRARLQLALGFADGAAFESALAAARRTVQAQFEAVAAREHEPGDAAARCADFGALWRDNADAASWATALAAENFPSADALAAAIAGFRNASGTVKLGGQAAERLALFIPRLLRIARDCGQPFEAVTRSLTVLGGILRRSAYLALLNENPDAATRFVRLCGESAYLATELARFPILLDELLEPGVLRAPPRRDDLARDLSARLAGLAGADAETQMEILAEFKRAAMFRIAVADFSGTLQVMQVSDGLTWLAEALLERALAIATWELVARHGRPWYTLDGVRREAGFGVIGYGKLGGLELSYGSDLDVVFLYDSRGADQQTDGAKPLDNAMFFARLVRRLIHFMSTRTHTGALYEIDTRLRPSGRKGLLVTSTEAFLRYQEDNAWTWEHQALLRARPVAGSKSIAAAFAGIRSETLVERVRRDTLREDVLDMRRRMRNELDDSDDLGFNLKHGKGGIGDIEFLVQYLVLANAARHPAVFEFTDNVRQLNALAECGALPLSGAADLQKTYRAYRRRAHRLALNDEPARVPPAEFARERDIVAACWQAVFAA